MNQAETNTNAKRRVFQSRAAAIARPTDPIFAAIERHRLAFNEIGAAAIATDTVAAANTGRKITQADDDRLAAAQDADLEAVELLVSTVPTTMAGLAAAVAWLLEYDEGCIPDTVGQFLETLGASQLLMEG